jgi:D5 N terminal like
MPVRGTLKKYTLHSTTTAEHRQPDNQQERRLEEKLAVSQCEKTYPFVPTSALAAVGARMSEAVVATEPQPPRFSEEALALRFSRDYADSLRHVGRWMSWDGIRWREDRTLDVFDRVRAICRQASAECGKDKKNGLRLASKITVAAVERLARSDRRHAATTDQWDSDPWLLNTPEGTVDLRTGEMQEHRRGLYITKLTAAGPGSDCPLWLRFLSRITDGNAELQSFLQRMMGYCLTGSTREHALFFMFGTGANGKSVFLSTMAGLLGDYSKTAPVSIFTVSNASSILPTWRASAEPVSSPPSRPRMVAGGQKRGSSL